MKNSMNLLSYLKKCEFIIYFEENKSNESEVCVLDGSMTTKVCVDGIELIIESDDCIVSCCTDNVLVTEKSVILNHARKLMRE